MSKQRKFAFFTTFVLFANLIIAQSSISIDARKNDNPSYTFTPYKQEKKNPSFRDTILTISKLQFDNLVDSCITLLTSKKLTEISDDGHVRIMMCLNTIQMSWDENLKNRFIGGRYEKLDSAIELVNYNQNIIKIYPEFKPNRGMGFFFPKLKMELGGTPSTYACFYVAKE